MEGCAIDEAVSFGKQHLHIDHFRNHQRQVIVSYLRGKDVLFCSPTGTGKSLTFEIAPFVFQKLNDSNHATVIVISPFVARMTKQTEKCSSIGLKSVYLKGQHDPTPDDDEDLVHVMDQISIQDIQSGDIDIIFASPETVLGTQRDVIQDLTKEKILKAIFIDEAHCIAKFGKCNTGVKNIRNEKAFRPAYGTLGDLRALAPGIPVIALTATATKTTRDVIINEMCMSGCEQILLSPNKGNIKYWQISTSGNIRQDFSWLVALLRERNRQTPRMLIFFRKIKQIGDLFDFLKSELKHDAFINNSDDGVNSHKNRLFDMFHSKTNREVKKYVSQSFMDPNGFKRVILCSTSFSMGLDLQSVDTVIHYGPANNVEDYIQETGRAGRDPEKQAHALLMNFRHCLSGRRNISDEMKQYVRTKVCRRVELLKSFDQNPQQIQPLHKCCDNCAISCKCLCYCIDSCTCNTPCSECRCDILELYKTSLDSSDSSSSHSDSEHEDHETSSDSDIASGSRFSHVTLNYTSEED